MYMDSVNRPVTDPDTLERIRLMRVPPAYKDVVICKNPDSNVLAYGRDAKGRKQTVYSRKFIESQRERRFANLAGFRNTYNRIKRDVAEKLQSDATPPKERLIGLIVSLMIKCNFRIGSAENVQKYGTFGLTTLQKRHVTLTAADKAAFSFNGKKGVTNEAVCGDRLIVRELRRLKQTGAASSPLFSYKESGNLRTIPAKDVNEYLKGFDVNITAKDLRTYTANMLFVDFFKKEARAAKPASDTAWKKAVREAVKRVAASLHNTPPVCRADYIHRSLTIGAETDAGFRRRLLAGLL